jgi:hypothetical protein
MTLTARAALEGAFIHATALCERRAERPLDFLRWLPLQYAFLRSPAKVKQIRAGNQTIGKTTPALAELVWRCLGSGPFGAYAPPPITGWIVCASWSQSLEIQKKLWALLPKAELAERTHFDAINGFSPTKSPAIVFRNGSIIRIKTANQDALDFAGATIDVILFDEPPKRSRTFTEALQRVQERGGVVLLSYTPINAPTEYLRELVDAGQIEDHWAQLTPEQLIPVGATEPIRTADGRPKDAAWIAERRAKVPPHEVDVVIGGEWETRAVGAYFSHVFRARGPTAHVSPQLPAGRAKVLLGIDHGHRPGKQTAILMAVVEATNDNENPRVYVLDEYSDTTGHATPKEDAAGILRMLEINGLQWHNVDFVCGDRVHLPGSGEQKSNLDLAVQVAKRLKVPLRALRPIISTAKKRQDSPSDGCRWLFHAMARPGHFVVSPKCTRTIAALENFRGPKTIDDEWHDPIDAMRYGLQHFIYAGRWKGATMAPSVRFD